ncbi:hypothetical protein IQ230_09700 [Gloeocapsopsis crepidinum LEGE 06123]|uniref:Uncharacterized protein n=1 Tax=Gloeocapsopsis crepidinum LEGE 06123 TaxID=588587 RepID=A0ABR9USM8_9CHRO|nr:hypothetical protein [Gloeocapsopsis crepidinum]MBE9190630.1 hypothetical protein [Gloeocapsopsis crepidinum LEGE 06123]
MAEFDLSSLAPALPDAIPAPSDIPELPPEHEWHNDFPDARVTSGTEQFEKDFVAANDVPERDLDSEISAYESAIQRQQKELTEPDQSLQIGGAVANTVYTLAEDEGFQAYLESSDYLDEADGIELAPEFASALERTFSIDADTAKHAIAYFGFDDNAVQLFADVLLNRKPKTEQVSTPIQGIEERTEERQDYQEDAFTRQLKEENEYLRQQLKTRPVEREEIDVEAQAEYYAKEFDNIKNSNPRWSKLDAGTWDYYLSSMIDVYNQLPPAKQKHYDSVEGSKKILNYLEKKWDEKRGSSKSSSKPNNNIKTRFKQSEIDRMSQAEYEKYADQIYYAYSRNLVDLNR